ncbi:MAG TPA: radical SAM family heme chaperone HemW [Candidatus Wallbacteria bacterium]|nr:radical SAM family heme chaperone HemW [Candidatus Wallbacteria bacterium]
MKKGLHVYVHIPFCLKKCYYCDFSSVGMDAMSGRAENIFGSYYERLKKELDFRSKELKKSCSISTIYFGGGTPPVAGIDRLAGFLKNISEIFDVQKDAEITFETNPAILDEEGFSLLKKAGFNRVSIGTQSFDDPALKMLGRAHNAKDALNSVSAAASGGFENISIDLMIALPEKPGKKTSAFDGADIPYKSVSHISAYQFSVCEATVIDRLVSKGELEKADEETTAGVYLDMCEKLKKAGYLQYEISNFAKSVKFISRHNYSYWSGEDYIGLGASAVSTLGRERATNLSDIHEYIASEVSSAKSRFVEKLSDMDVMTEKIMLGLRTYEGLRKCAIGSNEYKKIFDRTGKMLRKLNDEGFLTADGEAIKLMPKGYMVMNNIAVIIARALEN